MSNKLIKQNDWDRIMFTMITKKTVFCPETSFGIRN